MPKNIIHDVNPLKITLNVFIGGIASKNGIAGLGNPSSPEATTRQVPASPEATQDKLGLFFISSLFIVRSSLMLNWANLAVGGRENWL